MNRSLVAAFAAVLLLLVGLSTLGEGGAGSAGAGGAPAAPVQTIAQRVERLRGLRFPRAPRVERLSAQETRKAGLEDFDRSYPADERRADETVLRTLGLLEREDDLRDIAGSIFGEQVAGFYDPRTKRLALVEGAASQGRVLDEIIIAHELTHALEDADLGLRTDELDGGSDDEQLAYTALVEGTATAVMYEYADRHFSREEAIGGLLGSAFQQPGTSEIPPFVLAQLLFPYMSGKTFVERLYALGGNTWKLVDLAHERRPPESTEQVLHPDKWVEAEPPAEVVMLRVAPVLGFGWRRTRTGTLGEWAISEWLRSEDAAVGWGGDRYELWQREGGGPPCDAPPCMDRTALVLRWRGDFAEDAAEFEDAVRERVGDAAAVRRGPDPREVTVAWGPDAALAARLAGSTRR